MIGRFSLNIARQFVFDTPTLKKSMPQTSMDVASSIITQVARDGEPINNGFISTKDTKSLKGSVKRKPKSDNQKGTFRSLLCCLGRPARRKTQFNHPAPQDSWNTTTQNGKSDHTPP
uniref:Uncharacterized protein n=1 Tax=Ciona savignyi TaxID=51511 RepID=H2YU86_CIOSA